MSTGAYSGRWVARLRGRIIAQGGTPEQARLAALSHYKEIPEIIFMPPDVPLVFPSILESVRKILTDQPLYLVGGAVRDGILCRPVHDLDFAVAQDGIGTARRVANAFKADFYPLDVQRDTGRVLIPGEQNQSLCMDFATFRGDDLEADLLGRDFTVNAIAMDVHTNEIHDPLGGGTDLKAKLLRQCTPASCGDDPVRILRGVRLSVEYGFHILTETRQAMKAHADKLAGVSAERVRDELLHILEGPDPAACMRAMEMLGALAVILPELTRLKGVRQPEPHVHDVWEHTLSVLTELGNLLAALSPQYDPEKAADVMNGLLVMRIGRYREQISAHLIKPVIPGRTRRGLLFLAALYHDIAKPETKQIDQEGRLRFWNHDQLGAKTAGQRARQLTLSNEEIEQLETIICEHMRVHFYTSRLIREGKPPSRRSVYRFFRDSGREGVDICLLAMADMRATYGHTLSQMDWAACLDVVRLLLENWYEKPEESVAPPLLVDGTELMRALRIAPGPKVGELLAAIREAQAVGDITTKEEAINLARHKIE